MLRLSVCKTKHYLWLRIRKSQRWALSWFSIYLWRQIYARCLQALYFRSSSILEFNYYNTICWSLQGFKLFASWCRRKLSYFPFKLPSIFEPSELLATKTYVNQIIKISCFAWENLKGFWNLNIPDYAKMPPRHIVTNQTYYDYLC